MTNFIFSHFNSTHSPGIHRDSHWVSDLKDNVANINVNISVRVVTQKGIYLKKKMSIKIRIVLLLPSMILHIIQL